MCAIRSSLLTLLLFALGCVRSPVTDRRQINIIPDRLMRDLGASAYADLLAKAEVDRSSADARRLAAVGKRIARVAAQRDFKWKYSLIDDEKTINAWCLPGGKIGFYTGILPVLQNEAGMAFVMGHEVAHAAAHHGAERMTQQLSLLGGLTALYLYLDKKTELSEKQRGRVVAAVGLGAEVGLVLPFSRRQESEADIIGMMYMARAGYPPEESVALWERMAAQAGGASVPVWLSTHPTTSQRKARLRDWMATARKKYERSEAVAGAQAVLWKPGAR